jgi:REP element-mobilizing transposase RayT
VADGLVYHATNRGNERDRVFVGDGDFRAFLRSLAQTQLRYPFELFGYALMTNHFHLLLGPGARQSMSRILQSLTVAHIYRYHRRHRSLGHVWRSVTCGRPFRDESWARGMNERLGLSSEPKRRDRPPKSRPAEESNSRRTDTDFPPISSSRS